MEAFCFNSVKTVSDWLDTQPGMITAAEREQRRLAPIAEVFAQAGVACDGHFADFWNAQADSAERPGDDYSVFGSSRRPAHRKRAAG
jgi:hypothetical protein